MVMPNTLLISPSDLFCNRLSDDLSTTKEGTSLKTSVTFVTFARSVTSVTSVTSGTSGTSVIDRANATAADSTWLAPPNVSMSVATTVRITLPASTVTASTHNGTKHCSSSRKLAVTLPAFASYSSTVPPALSTKVTTVALTISVVAPGGSGGGEGDGGGGEGGGGVGGGGLGAMVGG